MQKCRGAILVPVHDTKCRHFLASCLTRRLEAFTETKAAVESLGRKALVVPTDIRHEESVYNLAQ